MTLSSKSPFPLCLALVSMSSMSRLCSSFLSSNPTSESSFAGKQQQNPSGFILVHLNIHDSSHFCSKRHLFI
uniref:Secreted protein n=1 Tax=Malurus cyaneus samueli TaxID=2593467 RepID=A0A8C5TB97_9PASS